MIKKLKTSSSLAVFKLYTEIIYFINIILFILEAQILVCVSYKIIIKLDSETLKQYL